LAVIERTVTSCSARRRALDLKTDGDLAGRQQCSKLSRRLAEERGERRITVKLLLADLPKEGSN
jgi:hypothetical protein